MFNHSTILTKEDNMKEINSKVFGKTVLLDETEDDFIKLKELIEKYPVDSFGTVNKLLNKRGFSLILGILK